MRLREVESIRKKKSSADCQFFFGKQRKRSPCFRLGANQGRNTTDRCHWQSRLTLRVFPVSLTPTPSLSHASLSRVLSSFCHHVGRTGQCGYPRRRMTYMAGEGRTRWNTSKMLPLMKSWSTMFTSHHVSWISCIKECEHRHV